MKHTKTICLFLVLCYSLTSNSQTLFEEVSLTNGLDFTYSEALKMGGGAATFDYDGDGDEDLYIVGGKLPDGLFENDGNGYFTDVSELRKVSELTANVMTTSVATGDIDNDGYREIFVGTLGDIDTNFDGLKPNLLLSYNKDEGVFENLIEHSNIADETFCMGGHFFDSNQDGLLDLYMVNYIAEPGVIVDGSEIIGFDHTCFDNKLFINQGDGSFQDKTEFYALQGANCSLAATSSDLDMDGDPDLILANDFGKWLQPNQLFRNEGGQTAFVDISASSGTDAELYGMGIAVGDFDEDLDMDFYVTSIGSNVFFENLGDMNFEDVAESLNVHNEFTENELYTTGWGAILEDLNNDSYLDLFVTNGLVYSAVDIDDTEQQDEIYLGNSAFTFTKEENNCGIDFRGPSRGALAGDWNRDGKLDLITITNEFLPAYIENSINYYNNISAPMNWLGLALVGEESNRDAYGAKAYLHSDGRTFLREVRGGDSHASQSTSRVHFGLEAISTIDSLVLVWPSQLREVYYDLKINTYHTLIEGEVSTDIHIEQMEEVKIFPNPAQNKIEITLSSSIQKYQIILIDALGQVVIQNEETDSNAILNIEGLTPGIYTLSIFSESKNIKTKKIIITP